MENVKAQELIEKMVSAIVVEKTNLTVLVFVVVTLPKINAVSVMVLEYKLLTVIVIIMLLIVMEIVEVKLFLMSVMFVEEKVFLKENVIVLNKSLTVWVNAVEMPVWMNVTSAMGRELYSQLVIVTVHNLIVCQNVVVHVRSMNVVYAVDQVSQMVLVTVKEMVSIVKVSVVVSLK